MNAENPCIGENISPNVTESLLVVLAHRTSVVSLTTKIYGLSIARRIALSAKSAGFERVILFTPDDQVTDIDNLLEETPARAASPKNALTDLADLNAHRIVVLPGNVLPDRKWLKTLRERQVKVGSMAFDAERAAIIETEPGTDSVLQAIAGGDPFTALLEMLATETTDLSSPGTLKLHQTTTESEIEDWLRSCLVKDTDGFLARIIARPISLTITRHLVKTRISANAMSVFSAAIGLCGAPFFLSSEPKYQIIGGLLFTIHSILDGCDGELARLRFSESHLGGLLDYWGDNVVHVAVFACMGIGWSLSADASWAHWPLIAGCAAVLGTIGSASFVHWRTMRRPKSTKKAAGPVFTSVAQSSGTDISKILDELARRDFIYLVLLLSAFGKASWFLVLAAAGAPVFFLLLLWVAYSEAKLKTK